MSRGSGDRPLGYHRSSRGTRQPFWGHPQEASTQQMALDLSHPAQTAIVLTTAQLYSMKYTSIDDASSVVNGMHPRQWYALE